MTRLQRHILFWIAYVFFKTYLNVSDDPNQPLGVYGKVFLTQLILLIIQVPVVYFCFFTIDRFMEMKWNLLTSVLAICVAIILGGFGLMAYNSSALSFSSLVYYIFTITFVAGVAVSIRLFRRQQQSRVREVILQKEKTETELKYLKGQINPHFLFNTLNNIYSLARKGSEQTPEAVLRLSKMMRFILYEAANSTIPLRDELQLIKDYIELERLRYADRLEIRYNENIDNPIEKITPLLLIHFVENAFKHGVSESKTHAFIYVNVSLNNGSLEFNVENSIAEIDNSPGKSVGMDNIKRQLNILYAGHRLTVTDDNSKFSISLNVTLHNS